MQGKKKAFQNSEIKIFKTEDNHLTIQLVLDQLKSSQEVLAYLPDNPEIYARDRDYLFTLMNTID